MPIILDGTAGIDNNATDLSYTGTLTGGTGVVNLGSGQLFKDASGNVGIGTSSPNQLLDVRSGSSPTIKVRNTSPAMNNFSQILFEGTNTFNGTSSSFIQSIALNAGNSSTALVFGTNADGGGAPAERMRIDSSGNLLVNTTSSNSSRFNVSGNSDGAFNPMTVTQEAAGSTSRTSISFFRVSAGANVGGISTTNTATAYGTSSDYRLKENIAPMTGALAKVALLKPCTYKWKVDGSNGQGFIAHELAEVCPAAVTGEKDAVDAEGNPQYQGIDTSFLAGLYAAALQELKAINDAQAQTINAQQTALESLTARVAALENQIV